VAERGIGRGLAAILPVTKNEDPGLERIPVEVIQPNPRQPRTSLDEETLVELAESIKVHGILQPVLVRPLPGTGYELIAGERRWRAAQLAGLERIPAIVRPTDDSERLELALIENMARSDLTPVQAAQACAALVEELGLTKEEVGRRVGRSRVAISNLIRLLDLPDEVLAMLESGALTEGHGRALLQAGDVQAQRALARDARDRGLSVRETEAAARASTSRGSRLRAADPATADRADAEWARKQAEETLAAALGMDVRVRLKRRGCSVEIALDDVAEVHDLARRFSGRMAA
jgi:ParB family transcriptional regulator, chromosome partitioning protein